MSTELFPLGQLRLGRAGWLWLTHGPLMHRRWTSLFLLLWAAWPSAVLPAEPATTDDAVWEIESLEPGDFDYNLNEGRVVLNDRFRIRFKEQGESAFVIAEKGK
ncbi:MAG: hypothetical protein OXS32_05895, partial [Verrucomicrobiales bacterium]|nr:hypothetical protein [Verrucomicrobiales bacterium]